MQENVWNKSVRERIWDFFLQNETNPDDAVEESILISDGHFLGQRFRCSEMEAIWLMEENEIKLLAADGSVESVDVTTLQPNEPSQPRRAA